MATIAGEQSQQLVSGKRASTSRGWLVSPWFDALFLANIAWPLLVLVQWDDGFAGRAGLQFWQVYFVTTPHRWITLALVFFDRERFRQRWGLFLTLAVVVTALCLGVRLTTGALTCLLAIDYVWNAWHFAAQHHGVYRIYGRLSGQPDGWGLSLEKWSMRAFLLYVILRVATATWSDGSWEPWFRICDWFAPLVPLWLLLREWLGRRASSSGRFLYLISVSTLYLALLWAVRERRPGLVLSLATASALFHAIEYLSLVSWSTRQRHTTLADRMGLLGSLVPRWGLALAVFVIVLGSAGWLLDQRFVETWLLLNVIVAFLHYAYDGLIWKRGRVAPVPATAPSGP